MNKKTSLSSVALISLGFIIGLFLLGFQLSEAIVKFKAMNREVIVKGLAEREVSADLVIWPLKFSLGDDSIQQITNAIQDKNQRIIQFFKKLGFDADELSVSPLSITDNATQSYYNNTPLRFKYSATSTITLYSHKIDKVLDAMKKVSQLGEEGIALKTQGYDTSPEFSFTQLNNIKPEMLNEAISNARQSAEKFATLSKSRLGRIRFANQGIFSIENRDKNTPHIKKVRIVSTLSYYLVN